MSDSIPGTIIPPRTRKRILDPADTHEDDNNARRPSLFSELHDHLRITAVPHKKGLKSNFTFNHLNCS